MEVKTMQECIQEMYERRYQRRKDSHFEQMRENLRQEVKENGFYNISFNRLKENIAVTMHGPPDPFDAEGLMHNHSYFELVYVYHGSCVNLFPNQERIVLNQGDILLLNPNALHCPYTTLEDDYIFNIVLKPKLFEKSMLSLLSDNPLFSNFFVNYMYRVNKARDYMLFHTNGEKRIAQTMENIITELYSKEMCYRRAAEAELIVLFTCLARIYKEQLGLEGFDEVKNKQVTDIITYMDENFSQATLQSVADHFGYSTHYLSRMIKKHTNKNFSEIIHSFKLENACTYLETTDIPMREIAELVGFNDASYFHKVFKQKYGQSPAEYRKQTEAL